MQMLNLTKSKELSPRIGDTEKNLYGEFCENNKSLFHPAPRVIADWLRRKEFLS